MCRYFSRARTPAILPCSSAARVGRVPCDAVLLPARPGAGRSDTGIGQFVRQPAEYIVSLCDLILKMIYLKCWGHDLSIAPQLRLYRAADCIEWKTLIFVIGPAGRLAAAAQWILFVKSARAALAAWPPVLECRVQVSGAGGRCSNRTHNSF